MFVLATARFLRARTRARPSRVTLAVAVTVASSETGDAFASGTLDALLVGAELVLELAQFFFILAADFAMLVLEGVEGGANDVEFVHLSGDWESGVKRREFP